MTGGGEEERRIIDEFKLQLDRNSTVDFEQYRAQPLRSIESRVSTRVVIYNATHRPVQVKWITYQGAEDDFGRLESGTCRRLNTFVTHPWVFRDCTSKFLVPFDAMLARPPEMWIAARMRKTWARHQAGERVFFPVPLQPNNDMQINLVILKGGVYGLQELCLQALANMASEDRMQMLKTIVPQNIFEELAKFVQGQQPADFHWYIQNS